MHSYYHALNTVKKYGGTTNDYIGIHNWLDETKAFYADFRHRALRHHSQGVFEAEKKFGIVITNSNSVVVPVRAIAEQHIIEDCGFIPTVADWLNKIEPAPWMLKVPTKPTKNLTL